MREKLIECYLKSIGKCLNTKCRDCEYFPEPQKTVRRCQAAMVVDDLIANGVVIKSDCEDCASKTTRIIDKLHGEIAKQRWISVKDRLPEEKLYNHECEDELFSVSYNKSDDVLVATNWGDVGIAFTENGKFYSDMYLNGEITHWMHLPQPPEGE